MHGQRCFYRAGVVRASFGVNLKFSIEYCGKLKDPGLEAWVAQYCQRARAFVPIELRPHKSMDKLRQRVDRHAVLMDERGEMLSSVQLAKRCQSRREAGVAELRFCIGDADGFNDEDRAQAGWVLSLSRLTLPHRLAHLVLVEQLYRTGTILAGHPYHHAG